MIIATQYDIRVYYRSEVTYISLKFTSLLQVKNVLKHFDVNLGEDYKIKVFEIVYSLNSSGLITSNVTQVTSW